LTWAKRKLWVLQRIRQVARCFFVVRYEDPFMICQAVIYADCGRPDRESDVGVAFHDCEGFGAPFF
jgi:hypothetical protein